MLTIASVAAGAASAVPALPSAVPTKTAEWQLRRTPSVAVGAIAGADPLTTLSELLDSSTENVGISLDALLRLQRTPEEEMAIACEPRVQPNVLGGFDGEFTFEDPIRIPPRAG